MLPRNFDVPWVKVVCRDVDLRVDPTPDFTHHHNDYYGNRVVSFSIETPHDALSLKVTSEVCVKPNLSIDSLTGDNWTVVYDRIQKRIDPNWLEVREYLFDSENVSRGEEFRQYAQSSFQPGRCIVDACRELTYRLHDDLRYDVSATSVETTPEEAFSIRAGVCQDFAQIQIACLRSLGIAARYVSGYLRTHAPPGKKRLVGADQSHAWVSVYMGPELGWVDLDPTNRCETNGEHVPICIGRDYAEVTPIRGVVIGGGSPTLSVTVDVCEIDPQ